MLRRGKFSRIDTLLVWLIAFFLFAAGAIGIWLALTRSDWRIAFAGAGGIVFAVIYFVAAIRRRPL
jgi:arginine exporter protein ArgO